MIEEVLAQGRALAGQLMVDACIIEAEGDRDTDRQNGEVTQTWATVYSGPCRLKKSTAMGERTTSGEGQVVILRPQLHLPIDGSQLVARGHRVTITACTFDPAAVGTRYKIRDEDHQTAVTARRLVLEEVT